MSLKVPAIKLNDGTEMPVVGLGTYQAEPGVITQVINTALDAGYRHFDCADFYENEDEIGRALRDAIDSGKVKREELFIVSKVWPNWFAKGRPTQSVKRSLKNFGLDYLDQLLIHWPITFKQQDNDFFPKDESGQCLFDYTIDILDVWKEFEDIKKSGLVRTIGVSNFNSEQLDRLLKNTTTVPVVNQVESHPLLSNEKLLQFCRQRGVEMVAYSPLARTGTVEKKNTTSPLDIPLIKELAEKYGVTPAAICIKWQTQRGVIVIPKSATKERIISNINIFHFDLSPEEMSSINALDKNWRNCTFSDFGIDKHKDWPFGIDY